MHEPLSLAMQILYFERFLHKQEDKIDLLEILKRDSGYKLEVEKECTILFSKSSNYIINRYLTFLLKMVNEELGKTAQLWARCICMIHHYHIFSKNV